MNEWDHWYKKQIEEQHIPAYQPAMWARAAAFIARAEKIRKLGLLSKTLLASLLVVFLLPWYIYSSNAESNLLPAQPQSEEVALLGKTEGSMEESNDRNPKNTSVQEEPILSEYENPSGQSAGVAAIAADQTIESRVNVTRNRMPDLAGLRSTGFEIDSPESISDTEVVGLNSMANSLESEDPFMVEWSIVELLPQPHVQIVSSTPYIADISDQSHTVFRDAERANRPYWSKGIELTAPFHLSSRGGIQHMGAELGVFSRYHFSGKWFVTSGISYVMRNGPVGIIHDNPHSTYHFEMQDVGQRMEVDQIHYAAVPLMFGYQYQKWSLSAGARILGLIQARSVVHAYAHIREFHDSGMTLQTELERVGSGWSRPKGLRTLHAEYMVQSTWQVNDKWSTGLRMTYNPMGMTNESFGRRFNALEDKLINNYQASRPFLANALFAELSVQYTW